MFPMDKRAKADLFLERLTSLIEKSDLSPRAISLLATQDKNPDLIRKAFDNRAIPQTTSVHALARVLGVTPQYLLGESDSPAPATEAVVADRAVSFRHGGAGMDLPIYGTALGHDLRFDGDGTLLVEQTMLELTEPIRHVQRPAGLAGAKTAYAVYIQGDSMSPRYEPGELAVVDPRKPPSPGDDVIVQLIGDEERTGEATPVACALIKRLVRRSASYIELRQFNPPLTFRVEMDRVVSVHRVMPIGDLLGA
jgi:hypothetical protein